MFGLFKAKRRDTREGFQRLMENDTLAQAMTIRQQARERLDKALATPTADTLARITWELADKALPPLDRGTFQSPQFDEQHYWESAAEILRKARATVEATLR